MTPSTITTPRSTKVTTRLFSSTRVKSNCVNRSLVVLQRRREDEDRDRAVDLDDRLERGQHDPVDREQPEQHDEGRGEAQQMRPERRACAAVRRRLAALAWRIGHARQLTLLDSARRKMATRMLTRMTVTQAIAAADPMSPAVKPVT